MTLTASDVSSLTRSLSRWEYAEYGACAFVAIACAGEYIADFTNCLTARNRLRKRRLAKRSTLLLIVSLAVELVCLVQTNSISGQLIGSLSDKATSAVEKSDEAVKAAGRAAITADAITKEAEELRKKVVALSPRNLSPKQQQDIGKALKAFWGHSTVTVESYGMDGEGTALAWQIILAIHEATGVPVRDGRANQIVTGGFEWGVAIRGPESEMPFMSALDKAFTSIGKLDRVSINGLDPSTGAVLGGRAVMGGNAVMGGGGGPPHRPTIPVNGPVSVMVGIRPPPLLPRVGK